MLLLEQLAAGQTGASNGMVEGLWLWFSRWRSSKGSLSFSRRGCSRQEVDLFTNGAAEVAEAFLEVRGIIIGFVGILGAVINMRLAFDSVFFPIRFSLFR